MKCVKNVLFEGTPSRKQCSILKFEGNVFPVVTGPSVPFHFRSNRWGAQRTRCRADVRRPLTSSAYVQRKAFCAACSDCIARCRVSKDTVPQPAGTSLSSQDCSKYVLESFSSTARISEGIINICFGKCPPVCEGRNDHQLCCCTRAGS